MKASVWPLWICPFKFPSVEPVRKILPSLPIAIPCASSRLLVPYSFAHSKSPVIRFWLTVIDNAEDKGDVFPAASVAVAVNEYEPSLRADEVIEKLPLLLAVAEPKSVDPL